MWKFLLRYPRLVVACIGVLTVFFAFQLPGTRLDNDIVSFIPRSHPAYLAKQQADEIFGEDLAVSVGLRAREGGFFTRENLVLLIELSRMFGEISHVQEVSSLSTTDYIEGTADGFRVTPVLDPETFTGSPGEIGEIKKRLLSWEPYERSLFSPDFGAVQILLTLGRKLSAEDREQVYLDTERILKNHAGPDIEYHIAGTPAVAVLISKNMRADLATMIPLVILVVLLFLFLFFRKPGGVILPTITVLVSTVWTVGLMALLGVSLSLVATVIPVLMIAVGSAYGIHIVHYYYEEKARYTGDLTAGRVSAILSGTLSVVGRPVFLAGITTVAGFGSLATSRVLPMRNFGIFTSFGVLTALAVALSLIPSLILIRERLPRRRGSSAPADAGITRPLHLTPKLYRLLSAGGFRVTAVGLIVLGTAFYGAGRLVVDNALVEYFKENTAIRKSDKFLRENFAGTRTFSLVVGGPEKGDLTDPAVLAAMDGLARSLTEAHPDAVKVLSFSDFIKRMNFVLHEEDPAFDEIPSDPEKYGLADSRELRNLISQFLLLYSGNLSRWADESLEPSRARMLVVINTTGNALTRELTAEIGGFVARQFPPGYTVELSGVALIENAMMELIVDAQLRSILLSLVMVFLILSINYGAISAGLLGIIPLSASILVNFAVMGFAGIRLDITTAMVASVAIGIGIDYTIHFMSRYALYRKRNDDADTAADKTLRTAGRAIVFNAVSVGAGFAVLLLSRFNPLMYFGALIALTMLTSSLGAMTLLPAALKKADPRFLKR